MSVIPKAFASETVFKGDTTNQDFLHFVRESDGAVLGWYDESGVPQGTLAIPGPAGAPGSQGAPGTSNVPYLDIQTYGGKPRIFFNSTASTTTAAGTSGTGLNLVAANGFVNGDGVVIYRAGAAPTGQTSPPSTPTAATKNVTGAQTIKYKCVGCDFAGGLTAASAAVSVTNAPIIFGNAKVAISSISITSNIATVSFSAPINAIANQTIHVTGVTGITALNGVWTVASAADSTHITFAITHADGTGTATGAFGRISNVAVIAAISRASNGIITITTAQNHNFVAAVNGDWNPPIVNIENVTPSDLNGSFIVLTASGTTITCQSAIFGNVESGSVTAGSSTASCFEYIRINCPAYSGAGDTVAYYIYSDSANPGGALNLIGKTQLFETQFKDWGPYYGAGYAAPSYVPTTAPSSAQNQIFASTVVSGGGTTSLVLANSIPNPATGQTVLHDDSQALQAAIAAATAQSNMNAVISFTPPNSPTVEFPQYIINTAVGIPSNITLLINCQVVINETLVFFGVGNAIKSEFGYRSTCPQFGIEPYTVVDGVGSPYVYAENRGFKCNGILFQTENNGQNSVQINASQTKFEDCFFAAGNFSTSVPLAYLSSSWNNIRDCQFAGAFTNGDVSVPGQSCYGPPIGLLLLRASDNPAISDNGCGNLQLTGNSSFAGRSILIDGLNYTSGGFGTFVFGDGTIEYQSPCQPSVMCWAEELSTITINGWLNDSSTQSVLANWCQIELVNVWINNCVTSGTWPLVTGLQTIRLRTSGNVSTSGNPLLGQNANLVSEIVPSSFTTGSGTTDSVTVAGASPYSTVSITPTNAAAATMMLTAPGIYCSSKSANTLVFAHGSSLSGATFDIQVSIN
jgi:hypothetical protein